MNILIVGCGKAGTWMVRALCQEGHDVTVMDTDPDIIRNLVNNYDVQGICGNGLLIKDLHEAGVDQTSIIIATTDSDEANIMCCLMARKSGAHHCVARVRNPAYGEQLVFMREELGISMMVNPEYHAANEVARMIRYPNALHVETFAKGRLELAELRVANRLGGLTLSDIPKKLNTHVLVCAVKHGEDIIIPDGSYTLQEGDRIYITATHSDLSKFYKTLGDTKGRVRSAMVIGGGRISFYLITQLLELGIHVKVIEVDRSRCDFLSEYFPKADVICADGTDQDILLEEGIGSTDACIVLTGIDEENIILSLYAKKLGVEKVIAKISRPSLVSMSDSMGLENIISPQSTVTALILQYIRGKQNADSITTLYRLADEKLEAVEFVIRNEAPYVGKPLKDLNIGGGYLIAGIIRGNKRIIPTGTDFLKVNDSVVVVTANRTVKSLDAVFGIGGGSK